MPDKPSDDSQFLFDKSPSQTRISQIRRLAEGKDWNVCWAVIRKYFLMIQSHLAYRYPYLDKSVIHDHAMEFLLSDRLAQTVANYLESDKKKSFRYFLSTKAQEWVSSRLKTERRRSENLESNADYLMADTFEESTQHRQLATEANAAAMHVRAQYEADGRLQLFLYWYAYMLKETSISQVLREDSTYTRSQLSREFKIITTKVQQQLESN